MDAGYAAVSDQRGLEAKGLQGGQAFLGHRQVGGAGGDDEDSLGTGGSGAPHQGGPLLPGARVGRLGGCCLTTVGGPEVELGGWHAHGN